MKTILFALLLAMPLVGRAQDILVTEDGESITAWDVDISAQKIYYKTAAGEDAPMKSIAKEKVLLWKKADGTKVRIGVEEQAPKQEPKQEAKPVANTPAPDASDPVANRIALQRINLTNISSNKELKNGASKMLIGLLKITPESVIEDKNVELVFKRFTSSSAPSYKVNSGMSVTAKNKTDKTIYIYLGNTFFLRHGIAVPFNTSSASQAAKDGQAAAATGFSQSVIAIPAHSSLDLGNQWFFVKDKTDCFGRGFSYLDWGMRSSFYISASKSDAINKNEERTYTPGQFPIDFGFKVTYSFSEDNTQFYHLDAQFYTEKLIGASLYDAWGRVQVDVLGEPLWYYLEQSVVGGKGLQSLFRF